MARSNYGVRHSAVDNPLAPCFVRATVPAMTELLVRLDDLRTTTSALRAVHDRLDTTRRRVRGLDPSEAGPVCFPLQGFADHWSHGVDVLRENVQDLAAALGSATDAYARHEADLVHQLDRS